MPHWDRHGIEPYIHEQGLAYHGVHLGHGGASWIHNFYQLFIRKYAKLTTPISGLLKTAETSRMPKQIKWEWTRDIEVAFWKLNRDFTDAPIDSHCDLGQLNCLLTDHSGFAIADILNQLDSVRILIAVNSYYRKSSGIGQNYNTYGRELLAIVETIK